MYVRGMQGIIHGIDTVLIPKGDAVVTERGPGKKVTLAVVSGHRKLLQRDGVNQDFAAQGALTGTADDINDAASGQSSAGSAAAMGSASAYASQMYNGY